MKQADEFDKLLDKIEAAVKYVEKADLKIMSTIMHVWDAIIEEQIQRHGKSWEWEVQTVWSQGQYAEASRILHQSKWLVCYNGPSGHKRLCYGIKLVHRPIESKQNWSGTNGDKQTIMLMKKAYCWRISRTYARRVCRKKGGMVAVSKDVPMPKLNEIVNITSLSEKMQRIGYHNSGGDLYT